MPKRYIIGLILAGAHLALVVYIVKWILSGEDPAWPIVWYFLMGIDFPFSLLLIPLTGVAVWLRLGLLVDNFPSPFNDVENFILPAIFFGALGTLWYFFIPSLILKLARWKGPKEKTK